SSHAVAYAMKLAKTMRTDQSILVSLSGRGDKDIGTVADLSGAEYFDRPSMRGLTVKGAPGHDAAKTAAGGSNKL
ncbi:MAG: tryptophan synthase subunit beta, partial [Comamonas sp.]